jgi:hypothetical protein
MTPIQRAKPVRPWQHDRVQDRLDEINWARLTHAYGSAADLPRHLRALRASDPLVRDEARWELYSSIVHQGTRYQASAFAVPFLLDLVTDPDQPDRAELLQLLAAIAIGFDEAWLPDRVDIGGWAEAAAGGAQILAGCPRPGDPGFDHETADARYVDRLSPADQSRLAAHLALTAYLAVAEGIPRVRPLLADPEPGVAVAAAYLLSWFPEHASESVPALAAVAAAADLPLADAAAATALVAVGLLGGRVDPAHLGDSRPVVRWGAAVGSAHPESGPVPMAAVEVLRERAAATRDNLDDRIPYLDGDLRGLAGMALRSVRPDDDQTFDALLSRAGAASGTEAITVVSEALRIAFPDGRLPELPPFRALHPRQQRLLAALAGSPAAWRMGESSFGNFSLLMSGYGLPRDPQALRAYVYLADPATP